MVESGDDAKRRGEGEVDKMNSPKGFLEDALGDRQHDFRAANEDKCEDEDTLKVFIVQNGRKMSPQSVEALNKSLVDDDSLSILFFAWKPPYSPSRFSIYKAFDYINVYRARGCLLWRGGLQALSEVGSQESHRCTPLPLSTRVLILSLRNKNVYLYS